MTRTLEEMAEDAVRGAASSDDLWELSKLNPCRVVAVDTDGFIDLPCETYNVIARDVETAKAIAIQIGCGSIPDLYPTETDALAAWRGYPAPAQRRYVPFAVSLHTDEISSLSKRLI